MKERAAACSGGPLKGEDCASGQAPAPTGMTLGALELHWVQGSAYLARSLRAQAGPGPLGHQDLALNVGILALERPEMLMPPPPGPGAGKEPWDRHRSWGHKDTRTHVSSSCAFGAKHGKKDAQVPAPPVLPGKSEL